MIEHTSTCGTCQRRFKYADTNVLATRTLCNWCDTGPRSCADCNAYELIGQMYIKADGRVICSVCEQKLKDRAAEKSQGDLFVEQLPMF